MSKNNYFIVQKEDILFNFLRQNMQNKSKNNIKSLLLRGYVLVNNKTQEAYNYNLKIGDIVSIKNNKIISNNYNIDIIYEDSNIIVLDKPSGLLTISTKDEKNITLYHFVMEYLKSKNKNNKVYIVHRLDRDTSGIIIFSKNEKTKKLLQNNWNDIVICKKYCAVISGHAPKNKGIIKSYLKENNQYYVYSTSDKNKGKLSITEYNVISEGKNNSLVDINLKTGRKNQIRVHMKDIGCPIVGDKKYGNKTSDINRLCLHAYFIKLRNPYNSKIMEFTSNIPKDFYKLL